MFNAQTTHRQRTYDYNDKNNNYFFGKREEQVMFGLVLFLRFFPLCLGWMKK